MTTASVTPSRSPAVQYVLRLADLCLIHAQRLAEWSGHAPILEEDIALTNLSLDLVGQARALLTHAGQLGAADTGGVALDEDQLAFLREERDYRNPTLVELPHNPDGRHHGERDFATTTLRNALVATWLRLVWERLVDSRDAELAAIAGKALKEVRYHQQHSADWVVRLGDGTDESARRMQRAVDHLWRYLPELFEDDEVDDHAAATGLGPAASSLQAAFDAELAELLAEARLTPPAATAFRSTGRQIGRAHV